MRLEKKQFAELIAKNAQLEQEDTDALLDALFQEIEKGIRTEGRYSLKGFGEFALVEDGELRFRPDDVLALELNFEFAGLEPIEVAPSVREEKDEEQSEPSEPLEQEPTEDEEYDDEADLNEAFADDDLGTDPISESDIFSDKDEEDEFDISPSLSISAEELEKLELDEETESWKPEKDPLAKNIYGSDDPEDLFDEDISFEEANKERAFSKFRSSQEKERKSNLFGIFATIVAALIIAVASWYFLYPILTQPKVEPMAVVPEEMAEKSPETPSIPAEDEESNANNEANTKASTTDVSTDDNSATEAVDLASIDNEVSNPEARNQVEEKATEAEIIEDTPSKSSGIEFGLMGSGIAKIENSTTIVVHSLTSEESAKQVANNIAAEGYRTVVFKTTMKDGRVFWRVGIGQFRNFEEAAEVREGIEGDYGSRSFISKITF